MATAAVLLTALPAHAQRTLSLDETLQLAHRNNRDLAAARENMGLVQATLETVRAQLLPTVAAQGKFTYNDPSAQLSFPAGFSLPGLPATIVIIKKDELDFAANATIPLVVPGAYPAYQSALAQRRATNANVAVTDAQVLFSAAAGFYAAAGGDELVAARKHAIEVAAETVKNAKARLDAGVVNRVEVTRAELAYNQTVQTYESAEDTRAQAYRALATLIQLRDPFVVQDMTRAVENRSVADWQRDALSLRPETRAYDLNVEAQRKSALSGALRWLPTLSAFGRFTAGNYIGFSGKEWAFAAGVQADWAIYDGGLRDAARHQAEAQQRQYVLQLKQLHDTINDDIDRAHNELKTKRDALHTAEQAVVLSKETLNLVRAQHDAGTATQLDLLQAQDALFTAEANVAQARFDLSLGQLQLERNAGTFPPKDLR
jgi:outer membrane protein TolC